MGFRFPNVVLRPIVGIWLLAIDAADAICCGALWSGKRKPGSAAAALKLRGWAFRRPRPSSWHPYPNYRRASLGSNLRKLRWR
jgi:hypothetical protein